MIKLCDGVLAHTAPFNNEESLSCALFEGHADAVVALLLDDERGTVWSGSRDATVRAWDLRAGRARLTLAQHFGGVQALAYDAAADAGRGAVLSGARDATVNVWARAAGTCVRTLRAPRGLVNALAIRAPPASGTAIAAASAAASTLSDVENNNANSATNDSVATSRVAVAGTDGVVRLWDHHRGKCVRALAGHTHAVTCVTWAPHAAPAALGEVDGGSGGSRSTAATALATPRLVSGGADATVRVWDTRSGRCTRTLVGHSGPISALLLDERHVFSASRDGTVRLWPLHAPSNVPQT